MGGRLLWLNGLAGAGDSQRTPRPSGPPFNCEVNMHFFHRCNGKPRDKPGWERSAIPGRYVLNFTQPICVALFFVAVLYGPTALADQSRDAPPESLQAMVDGFPEHLAPKEGGSWQLHENREEADEWIEQHWIGSAIHTRDQAGEGWVVVSQNHHPGADHVYFECIPSILPTDRFKAKHPTAKRPVFFVSMGGYRCQVDTVTILVKVRGNAHREIDRATRLRRPFRFNATVRTAKPATIGRIHVLDITLNVHRAKVIAEGDPGKTDELFTPIP